MAGGTQPVEDAQLASWAADELERIGRADELQITSRRRDGTLRPFVTIWVVRHGDDLYVRSAHGRTNPWFRRALAAGNGQIRAAGIERDVDFEEPGPEVDDALHEIYHRKYDRYGPRIVGPVVSDESARATLKLVPR